MLNQFETKCLVDCGTPVVINDDNNTDRTLAVWKMQADTQGDAVVSIAFTFGSARVRVYDMPEGVNQGVKGENVLYDSAVELTQGTPFERTFTTDKPYLFIDFLEKNNFSGTATVRCYTNTSATTNPAPYYSETVDDEITIEESNTVDFRPLDNDIRNDRFVFNTLRLTNIPSGSAVAKTNGLVSITAPAWSGTPAVYTIQYKIKDYLGIDHCGNIEVTTQNSAVTIEPPELVDDSAEVNENESVVIGVLDNDVGRDNFILGSLRIVTPPSEGTVVVNADATITYFAPSVGSDTNYTFTYTIRDYTGAELTPATVTVTVRDTPPAANLADDDYTFKYLFPISVQPTQNDILTGLDLTSIRILGPIGSVTNPRFEGLTFKADSVITTANIFSVVYEIDTNDGLSTLSAQMTFRKEGTSTQPTTLAPDVVLIDSFTSQVKTNGSSLSFGEFNTGDSVYRIVNIKNKGSQNLSISSVGFTGDFTGQNFNGSLPPNSQQSIVVTMDTATAGTKTGTITVNSNDPETAAYTINLTGGSAVVLAPKLNIYDAAFNTYKAPNSNKNFGTHSQGETITRLFELRNEGNTALSVTSANCSGNDFDSSFSGSIPAGGRTTVSVTMDTATGGSKSGVFTVVSDDPSAPSYPINLSGEVLETVATEPNIILIDASTATTKFNYQVINFGAQDLSATVTKILRIRNNGSAPLTVNSITDPSGFTSSGFSSGTIAVGGFQDFTVTMDTSSEATLEGLLAIASNDPDTPTFNLSLTGTVVDNAPALVVTNAANEEVKIDGSTQTFSTVEVGENATIVFKLNNRGDASLNVSSVVVAGDFTKESSYNSGIIGANGYNIATVKMDTATVGAKTGTLTITSDDPTNATYVVNLAGTVVQNDPDIILTDVSTNTIKENGGALAFGTVAQNATQSRFIQIKNVGDASLTVSSVGITGDFTTPAFSTTIAAGSAQTIELTMTTSTVKTANGVLTVNSDDPDTPAYTLNLSGEVVSPPEPKLTFIDDVQNVYYEDGDTLVVGTVLTEQLINEGTSTATLCRIINVGNADLIVTGATITTPYFESNINPPFTEISDGNIGYNFSIEATINIEQLTGELKIYSNDPDFPVFTIKLVKQYEGGSTPTESIGVTSFT